MLRLGGRVFRSAVDAFLFAVPEHAQAWREAGFIGAQPVFTVMPASTDVRPVTRSDARSISGMTGAPALLWVGRLNANKDPLTVLAAFEQFASRVPDATLTMIHHTDELLAPVRDRIVGSATLRDRVRLVGAVPHEQMSTYFSAADIFVVGSHHEGSGYSLMEALACGAIPVVTNIPTFRALTGVWHVSGTCQTPVGHLWAPGDVDGCVKALLAVDAAERWRVIEHFERNLTWEAVGRRAVGIYEEVARPNHG